MRRWKTAPAVIVAGLLAAAPAAAEAPPHIQAVQEFLLGWGKGNWAAVRAHAGEKVTVKVGGMDYLVDAAGEKADVQLLFPFRALSTVRVEGKVRGVTVEEIAVKAGGTERRGKGTVTLEEKDGTFVVMGVAVE
jgi:hypothetical protein